MASKRKCVCCGKTYEYCPNCEKKNNEPWMVTFDTRLCKDLFNEVSLYNVKRIGKKHVQDFVKSNGITDFSIYEEPIRKVLQETREVPLAKKETPKVEPVTQKPSEDDGFNGLLRRNKKKRRRGY